MLSIEHLAYRYPGASRAALEDVSLSARRGQVLGLLGPNGAGKTTLISQLAGLLEPQNGDIRLDGRLLADTRRETPTRIALAPQELAFYPMLSVAENLACFAAASRLRGERRTERIAACIALGQLERFVDVRADQLSGGLKRRLNLAIALLPEPELLLLDEPTVGVDPQSRAFLLAAIRALADAGTAVIYTSHYMEEIEALADHVVILDHGRVMRDDSLATLLAEGGAVLSLRANGLPLDAMLTLLGRFGKLLDDSGPDEWKMQLADGIALSQVLAALDAAGAQVQRAEYGQRNLEQLFMSLTHRSLRD
jgi:ABC-2 type transport system ATP-binding protein